MLNIPGETRLPLLSQESRCLFRLHRARWRLLWQLIRAQCYHWAVCNPRICRPGSQVGDAHHHWLSEPRLQWQNEESTAAPLFTRRLFSSGDTSLLTQILSSWIRHSYVTSQELSWKRQEASFSVLTVGLVRMKPMEDLVCLSKTRIQTLWRLRKSYNVTSP